MPTIAGTAANIVKFKQTKYIHIISMIFMIERFKPNTSSGTQCYLCQHLGHASKNCNLPERCVKCIGPHATKDCSKKERTSPAQCCNCNEPHAANFRQCPVRVSYLQRLKQRQQGQRRQPKSAATGDLGHPAP